LSFLVGNGGYFSGHLVLQSAKCDLESAIAPLEDALKEVQSQTRIANDHSVSFLESNSSNTLIREANEAASTHDFQNDDDESNSDDDDSNIGIDSDSLSESDSLSNDFANDEDDSKQDHCISNKNNDITTSELKPFAKWEQHTRGIAGKLMAAMGYRAGSGLGRDGTEL